ncbi:SusD/RagB family nutrient-binding outer membrane lipoprotein [Pedobacter metabolipauper]|uniref:SusD-like starch-binding protein associating with outer membrane n=1 Tax=Pedobacter metabolipauper TaxID=425513 RepID=A0A4R6SSV1_9SPHI|nr:SusD/RagB family nutrient-binding outer membrane lipoprotein [Pedobacter metabolipauper]TDQ07638.1 SusD-like starch-binding protein associating with outer membrane [Pedobacter metabolipauper]
MNIKFKAFILLFVLGAMLAPSCKKGFEEINTDPNTIAAALPEALLTPALWDVVTRNNNRALRINNELMQDHVTTTDNDEIHRFVIRPAESDYMWNNWYLQLTNFKDMYSKSSELNNKTYMAIALICDVYVSSLLTDTFGDVPYSDANKGKDGIYQPKFDTQQSIYLDLFRKLEEANTLLASGNALTLEQIAYDPIYGRNLPTGTTAAVGSPIVINSWRKLGNSMYLRLLMRASGRPEANAIAKMQEIVSNTATYPIFTSNTESAVIRYTATPPYTSAFYGGRLIDFNGDNGLTEFFINTLNSWNDPRRAKWATIDGGTYIGIASGYVRGSVPERRSTYVGDLMNEPLLGNIINYPELQFILAEAALKGYITGDAKAYYENGVINAITFWGFTPPADQLNNQDIKWNAAEDLNIKMEKIHLQKYYTLFFTDFQQWFEYRRTGHPNLPKGDGLQNGKQMPSRLVYPVYVQSLNSNYSAAVSVFGADDLNTKVWWNK